MVGSLAHLPPSGFIKKWGEPHYGTYDIYATGDPSDRAPFNNVDPWLSARRLRVFWERYRRGSSDYKPRLQTIQNAENYATAAMEYYVLRQCGWSEIEPFAYDPWDVIDLTQLPSANAN